MLMVDPDETAEAPSKDWMEVTEDMGVKACWGVPPMLLALLRETWRAEVPKDSTVAGSTGM